MAGAVRAAAVDTTPVARPTRRGPTPVVTTTGPVLVVAWPVVAVALAAVLVAGAPSTSALLLVALVPAAVVDLHDHRLPDRHLVAAASIAAVVGPVERAVGTRLDHVTAVDVAIGVTLVAGPLLVLHLVDPAGMGFGDVKLGLLLGVAVAPLGVTAGLVTLATAGSIGLATALATRRDTVAFGPALVIGAAVALLVTSGAAT